MTDLPDAPWIREAETFGLPEAENVYCPICGEENPEYFFCTGRGRARMLLLYQSGRPV